MLGFLLKLSDWGLAKYKLVLQITSVVLIIILLVYVGLSNRTKEE